MLLINILAKDTNSCDVWVEDIQDIRTLTKKFNQIQFWHTFQSYTIGRYVIGLNLHSPLLYWK